MDLWNNLWGGINWAVDPVKCINGRTQSVHSSAKD